MNLFFLINKLLLLIFFPQIIHNSPNCYEYSCAECSSPEYGACTKCRDTFTLLDGKCPCSFSSCSLCTSGLAGLELCYVCRSGFINNNNECLCMINNCEICGVNKCQKCNTGYYYNSTLNKCLEQNEEEKIPCFDNNCYACFSSEKGACEICKEGYQERKGECVKLNSSIH